MYAYIKGRITHMTESSVIIETNGIGYEILVPATFSARYSVGDDATIYTYLSVREDGMSMFGFSSAESKTMFLKLIGISGVGPKLALAILGGMNPEDLAACIVSENSAALSGIKGVGKKTAERIIIELKDKMNAEVIAARPSKTALTGVASEAAEVLVALGYKREAAEKAVSAAYEDGMNVNQTVHKAIGGK